MIYYLRDIISRLPLDQNVIRLHFAVATDRSSSGLTVSDLHAILKVYGTQPLEDKKIMAYSKSDLSCQNLNTYAALLTPDHPTVEIPVSLNKNKSKTATLYAVNKGYKLDLWLVTPDGVTTCPDESDLTEALRLKIRAHFA